MLPPNNRLRKTNEIERVQKRGRSFSSPVALVRAIQNGGLPTRFAIVVSVKTEKRAVRRNLAKRRTREILRKHLGDIAPGFDIIVSLRKGAIATSFPDLENGLVRLLADARLLRKI